MRDTKQIGEASEARVLFELKNTGYTVLTTFGDNAKYDLVVDVNGDFIKLQVKTGKKYGSVIEFRPCTSGHNNTSGTYHKPYTSKEVDYFVCYCPDNDGIYYIPFEDTPKYLMTLRLESPKNGQTKGINMASDYTTLDV